MKSIFTICAATGLLLGSSVFAQDYNGYNYNTAGNACCNTAPTTCCPTTDSTCCPQPETPCDTRVGGCYCRYVHWQACPYKTTRCVDVQVPCQKQCCRMVPKYYTYTTCRYEPEYYSEPDCKTVQQTVCDDHCRYVPQYYWKYVCDDTTNNNVVAPKDY